MSVCEEDRSYGDEKSLEMTTRPERSTRASCCWECIVMFLQVIMQDYVCNFSSEVFLKMDFLKMYQRVIVTFDCFRGLNNQYPCVLGWMESPHIVMRPWFCVILCCKIMPHIDYSEFFKIFEFFLQLSRCIFMSWRWLHCWRFFF